MKRITGNFDVTIQIKKHIAKFQVDKPEPGIRKATERRPDPGHVRQDGAQVVHFPEKLQRPEVLIGSTYKIKTPVSEHAMYVTINDIVLNEGTQHERRRPFEVFINSKSLEQFQWIVALTRIISAVFRMSGDLSFLGDELKSVFDPRGGYWKPGGKFMPSIIAELGHVIETHLQAIGVVPLPEMDPGRAEMILQKQQEYENHVARTGAVVDKRRIAGARLCPTCSTASVVVMDGCTTCLNCGDSKCG